MLEKAIEIAARAHRGQIDKAGDPYILHVLRVMLRMTDETGMVAGVLHDIIEDTPWTAADLAAEGFPPEVVRVIQLLSRNEGESYEDFISRLAPDPLARSIKIADLEDNMDPRRWHPDVRYKRYLWALEYIQGLKAKTT